jgi:hypothetical protein
MGLIACGSAYTVYYAVEYTAKLTAKALARASLGASLIAIPFWLMSVYYAQVYVLNASSGFELSIGLYAFSLRAFLPGGRTVSEVWGPTEELEGAYVSNLLAGCGRKCVVLRVRHSRDWTLGVGLDSRELHWLAGVINKELESMATRTDVLPSHGDEEWLD